MKTLHPNFNDRIVKLEFQLGQDREHIDKLLSELKLAESRYQTAMKRLDYLESVIIRLNSLIFQHTSQNFIRKEFHNEKSSV